MLIIDVIYNKMIIPLIKRIKLDRYNDGDIVAAIVSDDNVFHDEDEFLYNQDISFLFQTKTINDKTYLVKELY